MTNYEWLIKNNEELVKIALSKGIAKEMGTPNLCASTNCNDCDFRMSLNNDRGCRFNAKKWLEEEYEQPLYKKGDIIVDSNGALAVVRGDDCDEGTIRLSHFVEGVYGVREPITNIKKKMGNIYDESFGVIIQRL